MGTTALTRPWTAMVVALILALAAHSPAAATSPVPADSGTVQGSMYFGTTRGTSSWGGCYVSGDGMPLLSAASGHEGTWNLEVWSMSSVHDYAFMELCGDYGPIQAAGLPIGGDCWLNTGRNGTGTLELDLYYKAPSRSYDVVGASWKAASSGVVTLLGNLQDASGVVVGQLVILLWMPSLVCPSGTGYSYTGAWSVVPSGAH